MRIEVRVPMLGSCSHVLGVLGPFCSVIPPSVDLKVPDRPSFAVLRPYAQKLMSFRGARDLLAALTINSARGYQGSELYQMVNECLVIDEEDRGTGLDRLDGSWLVLWENAVKAYRGVWPRARRPLDRVASRLRARMRRNAAGLEDLLCTTLRPRGGDLLAAARSGGVLVAVVEPGLGMHRASERTVVLEALPYLWPYCLAHELVHSVTPRYRPESAVHQLAAEVLTDLAAGHLGRQLAAPGCRGFTPQAGFAVRWEGWKLCYDCDLPVAAGDAWREAEGVWNDYLESTAMAFEDAVDRLAGLLSAAR